MAGNSESSFQPENLGTRPRKRKAAPNSAYGKRAHPRPGGHAPFGCGPVEKRPVRIPKQRHAKAGGLVNWPTPNRPGKLARSLCSAGAKPERYGDESSTPPASKFRSDDSRRTNTASAPLPYRVNHTSLQVRFWRRRLRRPAAPKATRRGGYDPLNSRSAGLAFLGLVLRPPGLQEQTLH
jgi:hypothetical protein